MKKIFILAILFLSQIGLAAVPTLISVTGLTGAYTDGNGVYAAISASALINGESYTITHNGIRWIITDSGGQVVCGSAACLSSVSPVDATGWGSYKGVTKITVFGYEELDGDYAWDGFNYYNDSGSYIQWNVSQWSLFDSEENEVAYTTAGATAEPQSLPSATWDTAEDYVSSVTELFAQTPVLENSQVAISTPDELQAIGTNATTLAGSYVQTADINMNVSPYNEGVGFMPIGAFGGTYDGQNYTISGLFINWPTTDYVGLFGNAGSIAGTVFVKNVKLSSPTVTGRDHVGSLCGGLSYIPVVNGLYNCHATNVTIVGRLNVGGLVGNLSTTNRSNTYVKNCSVVGGNVSSNTNSANRVVGGFSGTGNSKIEECFTTGVTITLLSSASEAGGFCGRSNGGIHTNCYSRNTLAGATTLVGSYFGGSLSSVGWACVFTNCYAVSGIDLFRGGAISGTDPTLTNCYYQGTGTNNGATGKTEAQMQTKSTFTGWDFSTIWDVDSDHAGIFGSPLNNSGYPYFCVPSGIFGNKTGIFGN